MQGHPEKDIGKLIWSIYCIRVPNTYKIQNDFIIFQSIDRDLNKTQGYPKLMCDFKKKLSTHRKYTDVGKTMGFFSIKLFKEQIFCKRDRLSS